MAVVWITAVFQACAVDNLIVEPQLLGNGI